MCAGAALAGAEPKSVTQEEQEMVKPDPKPSYQCALPMSDAELRKTLSPEQYRILRENGTEQPFASALWDNKRTGLYVDPISGQPLFASLNKFDSGTGWPSFTQPIDPEMLIERKDASHGMIRTEVRSKTSDSHLGHVFDDGPGPSGLRYCINAAALKFVPVEDLEKTGYGRYLVLFQQPPKADKTAP
ncbi:MAG: peptide-methionine (R)-S-oxide reductase MsrB [Candidatus Omnitrophota bacterium]|nr:peptide-methionine (R)-S-oxide reductase MsrB [Candidatus Omnitrophota bacterium]